MVASRDVANGKKLARSAEIPARLWRVPVYLPYLQPPLTDAMVREAESEMGVKLPRAYIAALRIQNGGYLRTSAHPDDRAPVDCLAGIGPRFPSVLRHDWADVKAHMAENGFVTPTRIDDLVPFCGDGHFHYCFDYRKAGRRDEPSVSYVDVECFDVDEVLAPDFGTFLATLRPSAPAKAFGLRTQERVEAIASALSTATGFEFEDQGDQDFGYRVFRARLPGKTQWAWLSANQVRRGFVRKNDREYKKLGTLFPELVDRHPEHADFGYFLTLSDFDSPSGKSIARGLEALRFPCQEIELEGG